MRETTESPTEAYRGSYGDKRVRSLEVEPFRSLVVRASQCALQALPTEPNALPWC